MIFGVLNGEYQKKINKKRKQLVEGGFIPKRLEISQHISIQLQKELYESGSMIDMPDIFLGMKIRVNRSFDEDEFYIN